MKFSRFHTSFLALAFLAIANGQYNQNNNNNNNGWQSAQQNNNGWQQNNGWQAQPETETPTASPTKNPTKSPTPEPTASPTTSPTKSPGVLGVNALSAAAVDGITTVPLGGQLEGTTLDYIVNRADARAGGQDTITMTYTIQKEAWLSIGFTNGDGQMVGADCVIGLPATGEVLEYDLFSKLQEGVVPKASQNLIDTSLVQEGGTTKMEFTKILVEADKIPIEIGPNTFIGAYGFDNTLFYHERRDSFAVDLVAGEAAVVETRKKALWKAHGICAALAWGLFSPLAIGAAVLRYWLPNGLWFQIHQGLNVMVAFLTVLAFGLAVAAIQQEGLSHFSVTPSPHRLVGLVVFLALMVQMIGGFLRPHTPEKGEEKTKTRRAFEIGHRLIGITLVGVAWYQCASGTKIYQTLFVESADAPLAGIFWGVVGSIVGIVAVGRVVAAVVGKKDTESEGSESEV